MIIKIENLEITWIAYLCYGLDKNALCSGFVEKWISLFLYDPL
jgi:hypothetical protein